MNENQNSTLFFTSKSTENSLRFLDIVLCSHLCYIFLLFLFSFSLRFCCCCCCFDVSTFFIPSFFCLSFLYLFSFYLFLLSIVFIYLFIYSPFSSLISSSEKSLVGVWVLAFEDS